MTMRAYCVTSHDAPPAIERIARPRPGPGQIGIKIHACGLNFADLLMMSGRYQDTPALPFTLGLELSGVVDSLGEGASGPAPGTRVAVYGGQGGLADYGCFDAARAVALPDSLSHEAAAAFQIAYGTSHLALTRRARLQPGETLLVLGAAGGVGLTAVEIGAAMGARVIACARGKDKLEAARAAGAHELIDSETDDIRETCKALGGADVVYDPVGGDQFTAAFRACRPEARILTIGFASGDVPRIPANHLLVKNLTVMGLYWGGYLTFAPELLTRSLAELLTWADEGRIAPRAHHVYPLDQAADALELLRARKSTGKVVVTMA
ncbi:NADPH2:quinone reductase [Roseovarius nanhaiticus]|uniref:NADPH2:quinone reductase n=2 Tax=Roseovarius nanhaiticus TaxID=573024 RepID=A0A1N7HGB5_9RHOB|nr:NADPH2:quinone reductase [Roseovarius nanhaiticus]SIS23720.1 NADPH2:quinone reductase [Roseovarius nanhaiticus]